MDIDVYNRCSVCYVVILLASSYITYSLIKFDIYMQVFLFQGSLKCFDVPFIFLFILGAILVVGLGIALPIYALVLIYRPKVNDSLTN